MDSSGGTLHGTWYYETALRLGSVDGHGDGHRGRCAGVVAIWSGRCGEFHGTLCGLDMVEFVEAWASMVKMLDL